MLKKRNRLKSRRAFKATYRNNCSINDNSIILFIGHKKTDACYPTRVGFVVSKKIHKRAVVRNRIKRIMRESIRLLIKENKLSDTYQSLIFSAKEGILNLNYLQIKDILSNLLSKLANKNI